MLLLLQLDTVVKPHGGLPSKLQIAYQQEELTAFAHFGMNTFTDVEWGNGAEDPNLFNPAGLDPEQWVLALKEANFKKLIFTAKHHDGFLLFPTAFSNHSVKYSGWRDGKGDAVKEVADACHKHGIKLGIYLSPWDMNSSDYGENNGNDYNIFYMDTLDELISNYGEISEIWMDNAKGSGIEQEYDFDNWFALIKTKQPDCVIWSGMGPDARWVGNEDGVSGIPTWSTMDREFMFSIFGHDDQNKWNHGMANTPTWITSESDVKDRPGWFYHASQDNQVMSARTMFDKFFTTVGRNSILLFNVPPNKEGKYHQNDLNLLKNFGRVYNNTFTVNLAEYATATASSQASNVSIHSPANVIAKDYDSYWASAKDDKTPQLTVMFDERYEFDIVQVMEYVPLGQRVYQYSLEVLQDGAWTTIQADDQTIGYKRLLRFSPMVGDGIRLTFKKFYGEEVVINGVAVFKADPEIEI